MKLNSTLLYGCILFSLLILTFGREATGADNQASSSMIYPDSLVINEINYNSSPDFDPGDWVELYNPHSYQLDISNWVFKDEDDAHVYTFSTGTLVPAKGYIVIAFDMTAFHTLFPSVTNYVGPIGFGFAGGGELLRVYNSNGTLIDTVNYDDVAPWPTRPDGQGATLELLSPDLDNALGQNWKASGINTHGTPGAENSINVGLVEAEATVEMTLSCFPNPVQNTALVKINTNQVIHNGVLEIYNLSGQKVQQIKNIASQQVQIERNGLPAGCYFVKFTDKSAAISASLKIMVE